MNNLLMEPAGIVSMGLLGIFLFEIGLGFLRGFIGGWKKSLIGLARIILCVILAVLLAPAFYELLINVDMPFLDDGSILNTVKNSLPESLKPLEESLEILIKLPAMLINPIVFVILFYILRAITFFVWLIVSAIFFKKKVGEKKKPLVGGFVGVAQGFILCLVMLIPIAAFAGAYTSFEKQIDSKYNIEDAATEDEDSLVAQLGVAEEYIDAYRKSVPGVIYSFTKLDYVIYKPLTTVRSGKYKVSLNDLAEVAGRGVNIYLSYEQDFKIISDKTSSDAEKNAAALRFINGIQTFSNNFFENDLVKAVINEYSKNLKNNPEGTNFGELLGNEELGAGLDKLFLEIIDSDIAGKVKIYVDEFCVFLKGTLSDGSFILIVNLAEDSSVILENEDNLVTIGKTIDNMLELSLFEATKEYFFGFIAEGMMEGLEEYSNGADIKLHLLKWEDFMKTIYQFTQMTAEGYDDSKMGDDVVSIIETIEKQPEESGIVAFFENAIKGIISRLNVEGINEEYLKDKKLDIIGNKNIIGGLADFAAGDSYDNLANANNLSDGDMSEVDRLIDLLDVMDGATGDLRTIINDIFAIKLNLSQDGTDTISSMRNSLNAFKLIINAKETAGAGGLTSQGAKDLIDSLMDDAVFDLVIENVPGGIIDIDSASKGLIQTELYQKSAAETNPAKKARLLQIANLFGI